MVTGKVVVLSAKIVSQILQKGAITRAVPATVRVEVLVSTITVDVLEKSTLVGMTGTV